MTKQPRHPSRGALYALVWMRLSFLCSREPSLGTWNIFLLSWQVACGNHQVWKSLKILEERNKLLGQLGTLLRGGPKYCSIPIIIETHASINH